MDIRQLTTSYAVSPQIAPSDCAALREAGFDTVLCNRPDDEVTSDLSAQAMAAAAEAAGLRFVINPVVHAAMTPEIIACQRDTIASGTRTLAYCASGTRSTIVWMLGAAATETPETLLTAARAAGYDLQQFRPHLDALHRAAPG